MRTFSSRDAFLLSPMRIYILTFYNSSSKILYICASLLIIINIIIIDNMRGVSGFIKVINPSRQNNKLLLCRNEVSYNSLSINNNPLFQQSRRTINNNNLNDNTLILTRTRIERQIRQYFQCRSMSSVSPEASSQSKPPPMSSRNDDFHHSTPDNNNTTIQESVSSSATTSGTIKTSLGENYYHYLENELHLWDRLLDLEVPEGRCVGLNLREFDIDSNHNDSDSLEPDMIISNTSHWIYNLLHPDEIAYGLELPSRARRETFFIGRVAIREALGILEEETFQNNNQNKNLRNDIGADHNKGVGIPPILKDEHGRPTMPKGYLGSISHKERAGVGIVARDETYSSPGDPPKVGIGIDLERTNNNPRRSIARRVLTEKEIQSLGKIEGVTEEEEVMLRFSLKECIYKAVHPLICQYVGFQEAEVTPYSNGTASVTWNLKSGAEIQLGEITAHWQRLEGYDYFLSSSSAVLAEGTTISSNSKSSITDQINGNQEG